MLHETSYIYHHIHHCLQCINSLPKESPHWTEQIQSIGVGVGGLFAGMGGLKIGLDWLEQERLKRKLPRLRQRYPIDSLNKDYELVDTNINPGKWWLLDKNNLEKYWIRNLETARDMGWSYSMVKRVSEQTLNKYKESTPIDTKSL